MRPDLVPRPDARTTSDLTPEGALTGVFGSGVFLLFSERFRVSMGYDWRRTESGFQPHPRSRTLFPARKCIPWMHHAAVPHAILEGPDGDCEWLAVLGSFGPRYDWADGTEANYPQYGILAVARDRTGALWDDGECLALAVRDAAGLHDLSSLSWRFEHVPGRLMLHSDGLLGTANPPRTSTSRAGMGKQDAEPSRTVVDSVTVMCPPGERSMQVQVAFAEAVPDRVLELRTRVLLRQLTVAPEAWREPIDVLDAPFGFQKFRSHVLRPRLQRTGVSFHAAELGTRTDLVTWPPPLAVKIAPTDACDESFRLAATAFSGDGEAHPCHDVFLEIPCPDPGTVTVRVALEKESIPARVRATDAAGEGASASARIGEVAAQMEAVDDGAACRDLEALGLTLSTGDRHVDGLWRWSRNVAHALCWPNGVLTTGALGYGAKSHVAQDVPFVWPMLVLDPHPRLRHTATTMLQRLVSNPRDGRSAGILDHPCDGRDFAFLPLRPTTARFFKRHGVAGLMRWALCVERGCAAGVDRDLVHSAFELIEACFLEHHVPFHPWRRAWAAGEETQGLGYSVTTAIAGLASLQRLSLEFRGHAPAWMRRERQRLRRFLLTSTVDGGLRITVPRRRGEQRLESGWFVAPGQELLEGWRFSFDVPLISAHALRYGALPEHVESLLVRRFVDPRNPWLVEGSGLAKSQHGQKGVWFWHNALVAGALMQCGELDRAWQHFQWMGRAMGDFNGQGIPGEEINGGDHAMGIGALAGLCALEGLLGLQVVGSRTLLQPRLPTSVREMRVEGLVVEGRPRSVHVTRSGEGPRISRRALEVQDEERIDFVV